MWDEITYPRPDYAISSYTLLGMWFLILVAIEIKPPLQKESYITIQSVFVPNIPV